MRFVSRAGPWVSVMGGVWALLVRGMLLPVWLVGLVLVRSWWHLARGVWGLQRLLHVASGGWLIRAPGDKIVGQDLTWGVPDRPPPLVNWGPGL